MCTHTGGYVRLSERSHPIAGSPALQREVAERPLRVERSATQREADGPVRRELAGRITGTADMDDTKIRDKPTDSDRASPELGVVGIDFNPDAEDRLRRLFSPDDGGEAEG